MPQADMACAQAVRDGALQLQRKGIIRLTEGNLSARCADADACIITPSGMAYGVCTAADMVKVTFGGTAPRLGVPPLDRRAPSSEWRFHHDIYRRMPDVGAVVHAHSPFATALACQGREIPAFHYMIARFGGDSVRCAAYARVGTQALSDAVLAALDGRRACLMMHHGMLVAGDDLAQALDLAQELENLCEIYWRVCQLGTVKVLDAAQMRAVVEQFRSYGQPRQTGAS